MEKLLKRLTQFSAGTLLGALLSIVQVPILSHFLLPEEYGKAGLFNTLIMQVPLFLYLGLDQSYGREYNEHNNKELLLINSMSVPLLNSILFAILAILFDNQLSEWLFSSPDYSYLIWLGGLWIVLLIFERFLLLSIRMAEKAKEFSFYTLLMKLNVFIVTMLLILSGFRSFQVIVIGLLFGHFIGNAILIFKYRKYFTKSSNNLDIPLIKNMLQFGIPQMVAVTLISGLNSLGNIFINNYSHPSELGIYNLSLSIVGIIGVLQTAFSTFWLPTAYRWESNKKTIKHFKFISDSLLLLLTVAFYLLILVLPLVPIFIGEAYNEIVLIIPILTLPHILATLSETTTLGILFSKKTYLNIIVSICTFFTSFLINILLTPSLGYKGASIAAALSYFVYYIVRTILSRSTGFYFSQIKQILTTIIMLIISSLYVFNIENANIITGIFFLITLWIQWSTIKDIITVKNSDEWNFD